MITGLYLTEMLHHSAVDIPGGSVCQTRLITSFQSCYHVGEMCTTEIDWCVPACHKVAQQSGKSVACDK